MKQSMPTKEIVIDKVKQLIQGVNPIEIAQWAEAFDMPANQEISDNIRQQDPKPRQLIDDLSLAAAINEHGDFLYAKEDFESWLREFESLED